LKPGQQSLPQPSALWLGRVCEGTLKIRALTEKKVPTLKTKARCRSYWKQSVRQRHRLHGDQIAGALRTASISAISAWERAFMRVPSPRPMSVALTRCKRRVDTRGEGFGARSDRKRSRDGDLRLIGLTDRPARDLAQISSPKKGISRCEYDTLAAPRLPWASPESRVWVSGRWNGRRHLIGLP